MMSRVFIKQMLNSLQKRQLPINLRDYIRNRIMVFLCRECTNEILKELEEESDPELRRNTSCHWSHGAIFVPNDTCWFSCCLFLQICCFGIILGCVRSSRWICFAILTFILVTEKRKNYYDRSEIAIPANDKSLISKISVCQEYFGPTKE